MHCMISRRHPFDRRKLDIAIETRLDWLTLFLITIIIFFIKNK